MIQEQKTSENQEKPPFFPGRCKSTETLDDSHSDGNCSNGRAVCNIVLTAIGMGVVMLPTSFARCGWLGGLLVLLVSGLIANYMTHKLSHAIAHPPHEAGKVNTYEDLGRACFGTAGKIFTAAIVHITMIGCCSTLLLMLGQNISKLFPGSSVAEAWWVCMAAAFLYPLTFLKSMHEVGYVAAFGLVAIFCLTLVIITSGIWESVEDDPSLDRQTQWLKFDAWLFGKSFGACVLSFNIANVIATLMRDMRFPSAFNKVTNYGYLIIFFFYVCVGASGYAGFGASLLKTDSILDAIASKDKPLTGLGYACIVSIVCTALPHYIVMFLPVAASAEYTVPLHWSPMAQKIAHMAARTTILLLTILIALAVPSVQNLIDTLGCFTMVWMVILLPGIFYWRVRFLRGHKPWWKNGLEAALLTLILTIGVVVMVVGTWASIQSWIDKK